MDITLLLFHISISILVSSLLRYIYSIHDQDRGVTGFSVCCVGAAEEKALSGVITYFNVIDTSESRRRTARQYEINCLVVASRFSHVKYPDTC